MPASKEKDVIWRSILIPRAPEDVRIEVLYLSKFFSHRKVESTHASDANHVFFATVALNERGKGLPQVSDRNFWMLVGPSRPGKEIELKI